MLLTRKMTENVGTFSVILRVFLILFGLHIKNSNMNSFIYYTFTFEPIYDMLYIRRERHKIICIFYAAHTYYRRILRVVLCLAGDYNRLIN